MSTRKNWPSETVAIPQLFYWELSQFSETFKTYIGAVQTYLTWAMCRCSSKYGWQEQVWLFTLSLETQHECQLARNLSCYQCVTNGASPTSFFCTGVLLYLFCDSITKCLYSLAIMCKNVIAQSITVYTCIASYWNWVTISSLRVDLLGTLVISPQTHSGTVLKLVLQGCGLCDYIKMW